MKKNINKMSRKELIELASTLLNARELGLNPVNRIAVCDVLVESGVESLASCKQAVNDLIEKNKDFITFRKNKLKIEELGYFG